MRIGILSFRSSKRRASTEEIRIQTEIRAAGHTARIFRASNFQMVYDGVSPWLFYNGKPFPNCDVVISRPSILKNVDLNASLIEQMELMGTFVFNKYEPIVNAKNKLKTTQILDHYGIPVPQTVVIRRSDDFKQAVKLLGGFPVILKHPVGSYGNGVMIAESMRALKSMILWDQPLYLLQRFVKFSKGKDIRVFVVNGKVIGSMMRSAKKGEFRSNIELGGIGKPIKITEEEVSIALRSVQALDLQYGGVDIIRGKDGPAVLEVNSNPGFKALEKATGINVAKSIVDYAIELAIRL